MDDGFIRRVIQAGAVSRWLLRHGTSGICGLFCFFFFSGVIQAWVIMRSRELAIWGGIGTCTRLLLYVKLADVISFFYHGSRSGGWYPRIFDFVVMQIVVLGTAGEDGKPIFSPSGRSALVVIFLFLFIYLFFFHRLQATPTLKSVFSGVLS